jgi:ATP-dependent Lon protease
LIGALMNEPNQLAVLPVRNTVFFPFTLAPLTVGRPRSIAAAEAALAREDKLLAIFTQKDANVDDPGPGDLIQFGTKAVIKRMARNEEGLQLLIQGVERIERTGVCKTDPFLKLKVRKAVVEAATGAEIEALQRAVIEQGAKIQELAQPPVQLDFTQVAAQLEHPMQLIYLLASFVSLDAEKGIKLMETSTHSEALRYLHDFLTHEIQVLELQTKIASAAKTEMSREQREYLLRQQMRAIREELGETDGEAAEVAELRLRFEELDLPEEVEKEAERQLSRLESLPAAAPDFQVTRAHLELILELPWNEFTADHLDLTEARRILDEDHYGLETIKDRILEYLAVMKLNPAAHAPILCFVGPPGVGKTSLGQSIARAIGRKFERFSLGGLHDEAELRGHRRTYIGAMPGRVIQAIRRAGVRNPMLMLDEVDKLGHDYRGDPAAALLEILDPAQNDTFRDNYLDLPFDLSKVFFVVTANGTEGIPRPLLDRMEIIRLSGYTDEEKQEIARRYLWPRQLTETGVSPKQLTIPDDVLEAVISRYTREAGVRNLERQLGRICRKVARKIAEGDTAKTKLKIDQLNELLGAERFFQEQARQTLGPGVAIGLAWTETGGDVLYIEAVQLPDGERLKLTGKLGTVMQESAQAAMSYLLSHAKELGIAETKWHVHLHIPAGAVPKDGPSAGVTMATALASLFTGKPIRPDTAMTGEITLSGLVLPVGGIKEKMLAARRAGIRRVVLPRQNEKDLQDIPESARNDLIFLFADRIEDAVCAAIPDLEACFSCRKESRDEKPPEPQAEPQPTAAKSRTKRRKPAEDASRQVARE